MIDFRRTRRRWGRHLRSTNHNPVPFPPGPGGMGHATHSVMIDWRGGAASYPVPGTSEHRLSVTRKVDRQMSASKSLRHFFLLFSSSTLGILQATTIYLYLCPLSHRDRLRSSPPKYLPDLSAHGSCHVCCGRIQRVDDCAHGLEEGRYVHTSSPPYPDSDCCWSLGMT